MGGGEIGLIKNPTDLKLVTTQVKMKILLDFNLIV